MEFHFSAEEWKGMTRTQRIARCQALAAESRNLAETAAGELKPIYFDLAMQWQKLAEAISGKLD